MEIKKKGKNKHLSEVNDRKRKKKKNKKKTKKNIEIKKERKE